MRFVSQLILFSLLLPGSLLQGGLFNDEVRPILNKHCTKCHGGVKQAGGVSFVYEKAVLGEGKSGETIVAPGHPEESELFRRITTTDPDDRMPPVDEHPEPLSDSEIATIQKWIATGAKWENHWAFETPKSPSVPKADGDKWSRQSLDPFVLSRMKEKRLSPSKDARPERWLRRASLDLIGLPPTLAEIDAFMAAIQKDGEKAYEAEVDRLLNSPHYGERWASMWMDQIRYADSKGLGLDDRRTIWKYRDWLIDAFNKDLPYDQFTIKQLAGDLLPNPTLEDLIATAAHRNTQANNEGGTDDEEFRVMAVLDRVNTTWQVWQATTFGCVQCHHHPYDPFENDEYYKFTAYFNNTADADTKEDFPLLRVPLDEAQYGKAMELHRNIRALKKEIWKPGNELRMDASLWKGLKGLSAKTSNSTKLKIQPTEDHDEFVTVGGVEQRAVFTLEAPLPSGQDKLTAIRLTGMPLDPETARRDAEWGFVVTGLKFELLAPDAEPVEIRIASAVSDVPDPIYDPMESFKKGNRGFEAYTKINYPRQVVYLPERPIELPDGSRIRITMRHDVFLSASFALVTQRGHIAVSDSELWTDYNADPEIQQLRKDLAAAESTEGKIKAVNIPYMQEREPGFMRPTHVFNRGNFLEKDKKVTTDIPALLKPGKARYDDRLDMARWLVSGKNPLTSRVAVNRLWEQIFGQGIVVTLEDFGSSGASPTHPELLDHLALRFQNDLGWSQKKFLKEIALSSTYRQTSAVDEKKVEADPTNQWLARGPRVRLSAEAIRDQALAVSGLLSRKLHGEPVRPPIPDGVWKPFAGDPWKTATNEDRYRRALYVYVKRSIPYPTFASFDAPSREFCNPRRLTSNTPLQALVTMNDEAFVECAKALSRRMEDHSSSLEDQLKHGYRLATSVSPDNERLESLKQLFNESRKIAGDQNNADQLAMVNVASVLLNLDEVLTR